MGKEHMLFLYFKFLTNTFFKKKYFKELSAPPLI